MSNALHRSQIYIPENQIRLLKLEAKKEKRTVSELVRDAINLFLAERAKEVDWDNDPLTKMIGKIRVDVTDASTRIDEYLYGKGKV